MVDADDDANQGGQDGGFNLQNALDALRTNANDLSSGLCGRYIRYALEAGFGLPKNALLGKIANSAKDFAPFLLSHNFYPVSTDDWIPQAGDIIIFNAFQGINANHPDGI